MNAAFFKYIDSTVAYAFENWYDQIVELMFVIFAKRYEGFIAHIKHIMIPLWLFHIFTNHQQQLHMVKLHFCARSTTVLYNTASMY